MDFSQTPPPWQPDGVDISGFAVMSSALRPCVFDVGAQTWARSTVGTETREVQNVARSCGQKRRNGSSVTVDGRFGLTASTRNEDMTADAATGQNYGCEAENRRKGRCFSRWDTIRCGLRWLPLGPVIHTRPMRNVILGGLCHRFFRGRLKKRRRMMRRGTRRLGAVEVEVVERRQPEQDESVDTGRKRERDFGDLIRPGVELLNLQT